MAVKRILILANKDWEADPLVSVLRNPKARPDATYYPRIPFPDFGAVPNVEVPRKAGRSVFVSARAALYYPKEATPDAIVEVWAIRDLMDPTESGSSSREKARVLPELVKNGRKPTLIIAFGTATTPAARSLNGCVVVGSKVFVHNPLAGTLDPDREWRHDDFGKLMHSREVHPVIDLLDRGQLRSPSEIRFLRSPIHPADPPVLVVSSDFVAVSSVNVTTPALYAWADRQALEAAEKAGIRETIGSVETTHGVIRLVLQPEQFFFVSGIANGLGAFGAETAPRDYAQNFVASTMLQLRSLGCCRDFSIRPPRDSSGSGAAKERLRMPAMKRARSRKRARTLVRITDYRGNSVGIDPRRVIKIREAGIADEPKDTVFIDYASGGTFAKGTLAEIVHLFGAHIPLAALHAPNGMAIVLNADGIAAVEVDERYAGKSVAVVTTDFENVRVPARNKIALQETVTQAERAIESARGAA